MSTAPLVHEPLAAVPIWPDAANEHSTSSPKIVILGILMSFVVLSSLFDGVASKELQTYLRGSGPGSSLFCSI